MIIDEKCMQPPPPYITSPNAHHHALAPPPFTHRRVRPTISSLPSHILLQIVYMTFPQTGFIDEGRSERQRKTLFWLAIGLRLVNRAFYIASMHVLRSTYLPAYDTLIRPPYTSDPFPFLSPSSPSPSYTPTPTQPASSPLQTIQRETTTLDLFIALKARSDVWMDDSELHLEREEAFKDLFDLIQPRSRLEDLVRIYGVREGVVSITPSGQPPAPSQSSPYSPTPSSPPSLYSSPMPSTSPTSPTWLFRTPNPEPTHNGPSTVASSRSQSHYIPTSSRRATRATSNKIRPIPFAALSISFSSRRVGLVLMSQSRKRTVVEVARSKEERLEVAARKLVKELKAWLSGGK